MTRIRPEHVLFYVGSIVALFACAEGTSTIQGNDGDGGDDSWGSPAASSSSSGGTAGAGGSASTSSSGGPTTCDTTSADCQSCVFCSRDAASGGLCGTTWNNCLNDAECSVYLDCLNACTSGDTACYDSCDASYPNGLAIFNVYLDCVLCTDCYTLCDGATAGCP